MCTEFWVASHITGLFEINDQYTNSLEIGSRGAGLSIQRGVTTSIQESESPSVKVKFNGNLQPISNAIITLKVIDLLLSKKDQMNFCINHKFDVPLSSGFGASAAGALGTAFCINKYFNLGFSDLKLFQVAHEAEILTRSGLGDVIGLYQGGLEIRTKEGAPGYGKTIGMQKNDDWKIATISFGTLSTASVITNPKRRELINTASSKLIDSLIENPEFDLFIQYIAEFSRKVQLWSPQVQSLVDNLPPGVIGGQIMLGDGLLLFYHRKEELEEVAQMSNSIQPEEICEQTLLRLN